MMIEEHIKEIKSALEIWLHPDNEILSEAIEKTIKNRLFDEDDIHFQLDAFRKNIQNGDIEEWIKRSGLSDNHHAEGRKVLCLHAGNIPLVGFQDCLATLLSGADYYGKLSSKDPFLIASFLESANLKQVKGYSINLDEFQNLGADKLLFAGSESTVDSVKEKLKRKNIVKSETEYIIRTAKLSIAIVDEVSAQLKDAMFRYNGKGCRSVGIVYSGMSLDDVQDQFEYQKMNHPKANYLKAYYDAIEKTYIETGNHLIVESNDFPEEDFLIHWVNGGMDSLANLKEKYGSRIQSVYSKEGIGDTEKLSEAQHPPLYWKPDDLDVLGAILS